MHTMIIDEDNRSIALLDFDARVGDIVEILSGEEYEVTKVSRIQYVVRGGPGLDKWMRVITAKKLEKK